MSWASYRARARASARDRLLLARLGLRLWLRNRVAAEVRLRRLSKRRRRERQPHALGDLVFGIGGPAESAHGESFPVGIALRRFPRRTIACSKRTLKSELARISQIQRNAVLV